MKRWSILLSSLAVLLVSAVALYAAEDATWAKVKAVWQDALSQENPIDGELLLPPAAKLTVSGLKAGGFMGSDNYGDFSWWVGIDLDLDIIGVETWGHCVAIADDGSRIEMSGNGLFSNHQTSEKSASGGGVYVMLDAGGAMVAEGTWQATKLVKYIDYGYVIEPENGLAEAHRGGILTMDIELEGQGKGRIWVNCEVSTPPPILPGEGIQVQVGDTFYDEVLNPDFENPGVDDGGITVFRNLAWL